MGSLHGWIGKCLGSDIARQAGNAMLSDKGGIEGAGHEGNPDAKGWLAVASGIYATSFHVEDGIRAALIGTPRWSDRELSELAAGKGRAASLIRAYRKYGSDLLGRLHGPFALAIYDGHEALVAIDRMGIHRLSYAYQDGLLVFSTSTGSVAAHPLIGRQMDPQSIFNYFYFHDIPSPGSFFRGVEKLLPAQYLRLRDGRLEKGFYWQLHYRDRNQQGFDSLKLRLNEVLRLAVASDSEDAPVATFLSGGTDSSTITGMLAESQQEPVDSYSIGFSSEEFDEMHYARVASRQYGTTAHEYYLRPDDILEAIPVITGSYDEPFGNDSAVPTYFCAKLAASDGYRVMLAGDGGDEIFGGNERYAKQMVFEHYHRIPAFLREHVLEPVAFNVPGGNSLLPFRKLRSYITQARTPLPDRMESYNFVLRQPLNDMFEPDFLDMVNPEMPYAMMHDAYFRADSEHPINRMLHLDMKFTLADNDLRKVSRMCEAVGVEVRYPLLNEAVVDFSGEVPPDYKVKGNRTRWFFKQALKDFLPAEIIGKRKHGFGLPFGYWSLSHPPLREFVGNSLAGLESRGYLRPGYINTIRKQHANEHPVYFGKMIWIMVMLEQWLSTHT